MCIWYPTMHLVNGVTYKFYEMKTMLTFVCAYLSDFGSNVCFTSIVRVFN